MPQVSAALVRSAPSKTIASANIRRDAALSFSRPAAARSSMAVKSLRVTAIAAIVLAPHHTKSSSIQTFSDSGTPTSHPFSPLVLGLGSNGRQCSATPRSTARAGAQAHDHLGDIHSGSPGGAGGDRLLHGGGPHAARTGDLLRAVFHSPREPQGGHRRDHRSPERAMDAANGPERDHGGMRHPSGLSLSDRKSTRLNSSHRCISYAVFCF